jgi:hypothetical protein
LRAPAGKRDVDSSRLSTGFKKSIGFSDDTAVNCKASEFFQHEMRFDPEPCHEPGQEIGAKLYSGSSSELQTTKG